MQLRELLHPGDTVYTILRHVSRSGMQRRITPLLLPQGNGGQPHYLDWAVARATGRKLGEREGVVVGGCGMDMGFELVYTLSRVLFPDGFDCIGKGCPANDHVNARRSHCPVCGAGLREGVHLFRNGDQGGDPGPYMRGYHVVCSQACIDAAWRHRDGGYALPQRWL